MLQKHFVGSFVIGLIGSVYISRSDGRYAGGWSFSDCGNSSYGISACSKNRGQNRIIGGTLAKNEECPWILLIAIRKRTPIYCGGALISPMFVLSAAHCFKDNSEVVAPIKVTITVGMTNYFNRSETHRRRVTVSEILTHENHTTRRDNSALNDIALLKLTGPVTFNSGVTPVCLPPPDINIAVGLWGTAYGWGRDSLKNNFLSPQLRRSDVKVADQSSWCCGSKRKENLDQICACSNKSIMCTGDSGGPLSICLEDKCVIVGIISYGACNGTRPSVYFMKVTAYLKWIESHIC